MSRAILIAEARRRIRENPSGYVGRVYGEEEAGGTSVLFVRRVRESREGLFAVAVLVITGFLLNRLNVSITGMEGLNGVNYFPKWTEVAVTLSLVGVAFAFFALAVRYLDLFGPEPSGAAGREAAVSRVAG
jgi:Ni/Fe-hydrogenase subunit HybB-like protein